MKILTKGRTIMLYIVSLAGMLLVASDTQLALGVYMGAMYSGNIWIVSLLYLASSIVAGYNALLYSAIHVAVVLAIMCAYRLCHVRIGRWGLLICCIVGNVYYCIMGASSLQALLVCLLDVSIGVAFSFVSVYTYRALFSRGLRYRPALDELICMGAYYVIMCYALSRVVVGIYMPIMLIVPIAILLTSSIFGDMPALVIALLSGIGVVCGCGSYSMMMLYAIMGLTTLVTSRLDRLITALCLIVVDTLFAYITNVYGSFDIYVLLPTILSVVLYLVVPRRCIATLQDLYGNKAVGNSGNSGRSIVNRLRADMSGRLYRLSDVFLSMRNTFVAMVSGDMDRQSAKATLVQSTRDKVCRDCQQRNHCWRSSDIVANSMYALCDGAIERGSATILDIPPQLTADCVRLSSVLSYVNSQASSYNSYMTQRNSSDSSKLLIGEQLGGVSRLFGQLAQDMRGKITFDTVKEQEILSQLTFHGVLVSEVVYVLTGSTSIIVTVGANDVDKDNICSIVGKVVNNRLSVDKVEMTSSPNWVNVYLSIMPQYQLSYGLRTIAKHGSEASGDTHSFVAIDNSKCLLSVCDGMGSGSNAQQVSSTAITLVENFYKAGFDNDIILSCVNQLMATYNGDIYTAVDICVVDLQSGLCDIIKLGSSNSIVRCNGEVDIVKGNSLPLGAVANNSNSTIVRKALVSSDIVVLASDGIWDSYGDEMALADIVSSTVMTNPQTLADEIMDRALAMCNNRPCDDMTVLVARLL